MFSVASWSWMANVLKNIDMKNRGSGGVPMYVKKTLNFKVVECMTTVLDNLLKCITIEISKEKNKNIIVSGHKCR